MAFEFHFACNPYVMQPAAGASTASCRALSRLSLAAYGRVRRHYTREHGRQPLPALPVPDEQQPDGCAINGPVLAASQQWMLNVATNPAVCAVSSCRGAAWPPPLQRHLNPAADALWNPRRGTQGPEHTPLPQAPSQSPWRCTRRWSPWTCPTTGCPGCRLPSWRRRPPRASRTARCAT